MNALALKLIKTFEGFSPVVYNCGGGYQTIGYGHRPRRGEIFPEPLTEQVAEHLLYQDLCTMEGYLHRLISVSLTSGQEAALLSFVFNVGPAALERSTLRSKLNREEHEDIPGELMRWVWSGGKRCRGLERRRFIEGRAYKGDT